ncbi:MAG: FAD-linked oxidase C-terminal domain-containing protein [Thermodesulfobacteriota bacterium]
MNTIEIIEPFFRPLRVVLQGMLFADPVSTSLVSTDGSIYRIPPRAVCYPRTTADVVETVRFCSRNGLSIHPRGAGSGLCGGCLGPGVVVDFTRFLNRLIRIDFEEGWFECEPGYRMGELEEALRGSGLFFPPDPSSGEFATFGGMFSTNASGSHSVKYGNVADYVLDADIVMANGDVVTLSDLAKTRVESLPEPFRKLADLYTTHRDIIESDYPAIACNTAGYNLRGLVRDGCFDARKLFSGAEGTLGIVTRLRFRLIERPAHDSLVIAFFQSRTDAAAVVPALLALKPAGIEMMDRSLLALAREINPVMRAEIPSDVDAVLMVEFDGKDAASCCEMADRAHRLLQEMPCPVESFTALTREQQNRFWAVRKAAVPLLYKLPGKRKILALIEDAAVPTDHIGTYLERLERILEGLGVAFVLYGHIAKGLIHTRPLLDLKRPEDRGLLQPLVDAVCDLVLELGGTVSGEHGDGRLRSTCLSRQYPRLYPLFERVKGILDPQRLFNPEIVTAADPDRISSHLRVDAIPPEAQNTVLNWTGGMAETIETCHGCSKCTTVTAATRMCPIYKFTREPEASPKAKANVLREMAVRGYPDSETQTAARRVIERCIGCGSCRMECPSGVDIPKLALEARQWKRRSFSEAIRDRALSGLESAAAISRMTRGGIEPLADSPVIRRIVHDTIGIVGWRKPIRFHHPSLYERLKGFQTEGSPRVLYFPGCFANHVRPSIGTSTLRVLTSMGFGVRISEPFCCGLPMVAHGRVRQARERVEAQVERWDELDRIDWIVVSCSSCGLSLMEHWKDISRNGRVAEIAGRVLHVSDLVERYWDRFPLPKTRLEKRFGYHMPCHLRVQPNADAGIRVLRRISGIQLATPVTHCCGMGGTWGYETAQADISRTIGADLITRLGAVDAAVTDCPTCMLQIEDLSELPVVHPIEILGSAI